MKKYATDEFIVEIEINITDYAQPSVMEPSQYAEERAVACSTSRSRTYSYSGSKDITFLLNELARQGRNLITIAENCGCPRSSA